MKLQTSRYLIKHQFQTQQNTKSVCLAQVNGKVRRMWVKALFISEPKINSTFALDMHTYKKINHIHIDLIHYFYPTVIHITNLISDLDSCSQSNPQLQLCFDEMVTASTPTGLPLHTLIDTGCNKTLLITKLYDQHKKHFQNFYNIPFLEIQSITVGNWQQIVPHKMRVLSLKFKTITLDY